MSATFKQEAIWVFADPNDVTSLNYVPPTPTRSFPVMTGVGQITLDYSREHQTDRVIHHITRHVRPDSDAWVRLTALAQNDLWHIAVVEAAPAGKKIGRAAYETLFQIAQDEADESGQTVRIESDVTRSGQATSTWESLFAKDWPVVFEPATEELFIEFTPRKP